MLRDALPFGALLSMRGLVCAEVLGSLLLLGGPGFDLDKEIGASETGDDHERRGRLNVVTKTADRAAR
jgi:hypothetical protein